MPHARPGLAATPGRRIARIVALAAIVLVALATLGCLVPAIPLLGEIGPILTSRFGPWLTLLALAGAVLLALRRRRGRRSRAGSIALALLIFVTLATGFVQARQIAVARDNGVRIDLARALLARSQKVAGSRPASFVYLRQGEDALPIDVHRPARPPRGSGAPVLVYVHGGGWGAETLRQREADQHWFARRGYLVMSVEYSLSSATRPTWNLAQPQLGCALVWIGRNAARFGGDPARLALWGESAGGNLVVNVSYMANRGTLAAACPGPLPRVAATMALYPVVDPERMYHNPDPLIGRFGRTMTTRYTGGTPARYPGRYAYIGSASHISAAAPPTLLILPQADHLVVPQAAAAFAARARAAGVAVRVIEVPYAEHSFDLAAGSIGNQLVRGAMLKFLEDRGLRP